MELHECGALALGDMVTRREISPVELAEYFLSRSATYGPALGAYVTLCPSAAEAAREVATYGQGFSSLHGVPTAVKDLVATRGMRTTFGSLAFTDYVPDYDAHVVTALRSAGMPVLGKTNTAEFGLAAYTEPAVAPPARCPWNLELSAGGSSGGSAAAVAAGLVPVAHATDSAGSVRIPASMCGVVGLKVSRGLVSNGPRGTDRFGLACQAVLSRRVADAAAMLDVLATTREPGDHYWLGGQVGPCYVAATRQPPPRMRIALWTASPLTGEDPHAECITAVRHAADLLDQAGHMIEPINPPDISELVEPFLAVWASAAAAIVVPDSAEARLQPLTRAIRKRGATLSAVELTRALERIQLFARDMLSELKPYSIILTPSVSALPHRVGAMNTPDDPWRGFALQALFAPYTAIANVTGEPAMALPMHWTTDGLPVSVHLTGRRGGEAELLATAAELESAVEWYRRFPALPDPGDHAGAGHPFHDRG